MELEWEVQSKIKAETIFELVLNSLLSVTGKWLFHFHKWKISKHYTFFIKNSIMDLLRFWW